LTNRFVKIGPDFGHKPLSSIVGAVVIGDVVLKDDPEPLSPVTVLVGIDLPEGLKELLAGFETVIAGVGFRQILKVNRIASEDVQPADARNARSTPGSDTGRFPSAEGGRLCAG
jgi:hypothetical protein